jgi:energy-coupling factor transporter ATP-binding protein EcfA2
MGVTLPLKVSIENFKSVEKLEFELGDLTILVGPPASGKSNILDAIAIVGYLHRFKLLDKEYGNNASNLESLPIIGRFVDVPQLARYNDITRPIRIQVLGDTKLDFNLSYVSGGLRVLMNEKQVPWDLKSYRSDPMNEVQSVVKTLPPFEARLYGFDRYGLAVSSCLQPHPCGFHIRLSQLSQARPTPTSILSEFGWNAPNILRMHRDIVDKVDDVLERYIGSKVTVVVRRTGEVLILDYRNEVDAVGVSEAIYRLLYNLLTIKSSLYYAKIYGLEKKLIIMLEEPEAHIFPYFLELLVEYIGKAINIVNIVITTHNPLFTSLLCDRVKNVKVYYVYRGLEGSTSMRELDIKKLADEVLTIEDILLMRPNEVLEKYTVEASEAVKSGGSSTS